jgi:hypothetical protein
MSLQIFEVTALTFGLSKNRFHKLVKNGLAESKILCAMHQVMEKKAEKGEIEGG